MKDKLQFWSLKEWLTIYEATVLACGEDPSFNYIETESDVQGCMIHGLTYEYGMPTGFHAFSQALIDTVRGDCFKQITGDTSDLIFEHIKNDHNERPIDIQLNTQLRVIDIKQWLTQKGNKPSFFFPSEPDQHPSTKKQADNNVLFKWTDLFTSAPLRKTELFSECRELVIRHIASNGVLPSEITLWDELKKKRHEDYDREKQVINYISSQTNGLSWTGFRKLFKEWTK